MSNLKVSDNVSSSLKQNIAYVSGDIVIYQSGSVPDGWLECNGQSLPINDYPDLYSKIGGYYGSSGSEFTVPNLNGYGFANPTYPTGVIGTPTSYTVPTMTTHTHTANNSAQINSSNFTSANHNHTFSGSSGQAYDNHSHPVANVADTVGVAWQNGASNIANYSSSGTSGSHSYSTHRHNFAAMTVNNGVYLSGVLHAHTFSGNSQAPVVGATAHTHSGNFTTASNTTGSIFPSTLSCRFIIKV